MVIAQESAQSLAALNMPVAANVRTPREQLGHCPSLDDSARPAAASTGIRAIVFAGHQLAVPGQDGVWSGHIGHLAENFAAQSMTDLAERGSLGVRELQPPWAFRMRFSAARYSVRASSS
jgi:hypothetical protein